MVTDAKELVLVYKNLIDLQIYLLFIALYKALKILLKKFKFGAKSNLKFENVELQ